MTETDKLAQNPGLPITRIVHLSDLHFGAVTPGLAERLLDQIHSLKPDLVVISGDLTQRARSREFREAAAFIKALPGQSLVVPGNHDLAAFDLPERLLYPWQKWRNFISPELEPTVESEGYLGIGLNTARRLSAHLDWSRGRINLRQLLHAEHLAKQSRPEQVCVLVTHHPFFLMDHMKHRGLVGRFGIAWPRLKAAGIDLILSGHIHLAYARLCQGMIVAHAGSGISHRLKGEANSFNLISASKQQIRIEQMHDDGKQYVSHHHQLFHRQGEEGFVEITASAA